MPGRLFEILQFFDNSGNPLAGGKIDTFEAGTSTPLAVFTDSTLATAHPQPVVLDSAGRIQIWLGARTYKFVLKTSADVVLQTIDNIPGTSLIGTAISTRATATVTLAATSGAAILTASALVPANRRLLGAWVKNTVGLGTSQGLTGYNVGSHGIEDRWGNNIGTALNTQTTIGNMQLSEQPVSATARDIEIRALGGVFDGVGNVRIDVEFEAGTIS